MLQQWGPGYPPQGVGSPDPRRSATGNMKRLIIATMITALLIGAGCATLSKNDAIRIAEEEILRRNDILQTETIRSGAMRYDGKWVVVSSIIQPDGTQIIDDRRLVTINDNGRIEGYSR